MMTNLPLNTIFHSVPVGHKYFYYILPHTNLTWLHRSESKLAKNARSFKLSDRFERCANSFFDNSLIALHSFSFTQKIKDHTSLSSVRSIYKSDVPSSGISWCISAEGVIFDFLKGHTKFRVILKSAYSEDVFEVSATYAEKMIKIQP